MSAPTFDRSSDRARGSRPGPGAGGGPAAGRAVMTRAGLGAARWIGAPLGTVLAASLVLYVAIGLAPGDPVVQILGNRATVEQYAAMRHQLGLDRPLAVRYLDWLWSAIHGDLGTSLVYKQPVTGLVGPRLGVTIELALYAAVLVLLLGVGLGILGGAIPRLGPVVAALTGVGVAVPTFVAAQLLIAVFAVRLGWFPVLGAGEGVLDRVRHLTMPAVALALGWSAYVAQATRAAVAQERRRPHVETAAGRGLAPVWVFRRHVLRNAAVPISTVAALAVAGLFAGAVVVEVAFGLGGIGSLLVQAVSSRDYDVVLAVALLMLVVFVVTTTLVDLLQVALDPRLRVGGATR